VAHPLLNVAHPFMWNIMWSGLHNMETIQIVLDKKLLQAADQAARRIKRNRSALIRDALREHLRRLEVRAREEQDRQGYAKRPHTTDESLIWEAEAAWPPE
jgi:predicted transcriptional regulator